MDDQRLSILVIDDEPKNLPPIIEPLSDYGFRLLVAPDGERGLRSARLGVPNLILLDICMPGMDGFEVCAQLKSDPQTQAIPVIFLTALDDVENKVKAFEMGGVDYLTKPVDFRELIARVTAHLDRHDMYLRLRQRLENYEQRHPSTDITGNSPEARLQRVEAVSEYLLQHLDQDASLDELASMAATNRASLNEYFQILFGMSVFDWLREQRLLKAANLLRQGMITKEIATAVGYHSNPAFSTAFKRRFAMSPTEFRKREHSEQTG